MTYTFPKNMKYFSTKRLTMSGQQKIFGVTIPLKIYYTLYHNLYLNKRYYIYTQNNNLKTHKSLPTNFSTNLYTFRPIFLDLVETWIPFPGYRQVKDSYEIGLQRDFEPEFPTHYYIIRKINTQILHIDTYISPRTNKVSVHSFTNIFQTQLC